MIAPGRLETATMRARNPPAASSGNGEIRNA
jgi:hypothetical protein